MSKRSAIEYIKFLRTVIDSDTGKYSNHYNIEAVALLFNIPIVAGYNNQCKLIIERLKKHPTKFIQKLLKKNTNNEALCSVLVGALYRLFYPPNFPEHAPITISNEEYIELIASSSLPVKKKKLLKESMNIKYCHCLKKIDLRNKFSQHIKNSRGKNINAYPTCMSSIYTKRRITPPFKVSYSCKEKYEWYN